MKRLEATIRKSVPEAERELKWLFPASKDVEEIYYAHKHSSGLTGVCLRFNTKEPLRAEHMERALDVWQRKVPSYSCCIQKRGAQLWICQDPNLVVDFEVRDQRDRQTLIDRFCSEPKQSEDTPLWKARLLQLPSDTPCAVPEIQRDFPYQYDLIVSLNHCFQDAFTSGFGFQKLTEVLNEVIAGRPIDDQPSSICVSDKDIQTLNAKIIRHFEENPDKLEEEKKETIACNNTPILFKAFPPPGGENYSRTITHNINQQTLKKFYAYCKNAGVTFGSGFEAIINTALVEMIRDAGVEDESHRINVNLAFDMRRYMKKYELPVVGLFRRHHTHGVQTSANVRNNFWPYTQRLHEKLSGMIKSGEVMQQHLVRQIAMPQTPFDEYYKGNPPLLRDYCLSNMGDLTKLVPGEGVHAQLTNTSIFNGMIKSSYMLINHIYTYRGISPYSLSYNRNCFSDDNAGQLMERVLSLLENFPK
ncbi:uncharacterized protein [Palaemon carinicauda]|uniref:uncharacterized protein n=1 Tax=Palaemon carinicauda TaxID=392227 RepID=UPI0035B5A21C